VWSTNPRIVVGNIDGRRPAISSRFELCQYNDSVRAHCSPTVVDFAWVEEIMFVSTRKENTWLC